MDLSKQKGLHADPNAIQQVEFIEKLNNIGGVCADRTKSMFILAIYNKTRRSECKNFSKK